MKSTCPASVVMPFFPWKQEIIGKHSDYIEKYSHLSPCSRPFQDTAVSRARYDVGGGQWAPGSMTCSGVPSWARSCADPGWPLQVLTRSGNSARRRRRRVWSAQCSARCSRQRPPLALQGMAQKQPAKEGEVGRWARGIGLKPARFRFHATQEDRVEWERGERRGAWKPGEGRLTSRRRSCQEGPHCVSRAHARGCIQIWAAGISLHEGDNCLCPSDPCS